MFFNRAVATPLRSIPSFAASRAMVSIWVVVGCGWALFCPRAPDDWEDSAIAKKSRAACWRDERSRTVASVTASHRW